ncbi:MAG TPA: hypothetical protein V6D47_00430, partial [Oscillatoriaceae cyanobacterium]
MRRALVVLGLFTALLSGCFQHFEEFRQLAPPVRPSGATEVPPGPLPEVFPLRPGARYDYDAHFGLGAGIFSGSASLSVVDAYQLGDREIDTIELISRYFGRSRHDPYRFVRQGGWIGLFEKAPPDKVTFFMPDHLAAGMAWDVLTGEGKGHAAVEALDDVRVKAGDFPNTPRLHYVNPSAGEDITLWLAPHVGLVQADVRMTVDLLPLVGRLSLAAYQAPLGDASSPGLSAPGG